MEKYLAALEQEIKEAQRCELQAAFVGDTEFSRQWEIYRVKMALHYYEIKQKTHAEYAAWLYWNYGKVTKSQTAQQTQLALF